MTHDNKEALDALGELLDFHTTNNVSEINRLQNKIRAALTRPSVGWMPIESAPRDKWLLLGYYNLLGKWRCVRGQWFSTLTIAEEWSEFEGNPIDAEGFYETVENSDDVPNCWPIKPTHWMPLPAAPKGGE